MFIHSDNVFQIISLTAVVLIDALYFIRNVVDKNAENKGQKHRPQQEPGHNSVDF